MNPIQNRIRSQAMEIIVLLRHISQEDHMDFNAWMVELDSPRVRECLVAFELADIQARERGD